MKITDCIWKNEDLEQVKKLAKKGFSLKAISVETGIKTGDIAAALACEDCDIIGKNRSATNSEKQWFIKQYEKGRYKSQADAQRQIGITQHEFRMWNNQFGSNEEPKDGLFNPNFINGFDTSQIKKNPAISGAWR